jgi:small multidrug resistance pump
MQYAYLAAYTIWSGVALITLIGVFIFEQKLDLTGFIGVGLIIAGVIVLNLFSKTSAH